MTTSKYESSLSSESMHRVKNKPAYLLYTILWFLNYSQLLNFTYFQEISELSISIDNSSMDFYLNFFPLLIIICNIPS